MNQDACNILNTLKVVTRKLVRVLIVLVGIFVASSCSTLQGIHARYTYNFKQDSAEERVFYDIGAEDSAALVSEHLTELLDLIETVQFTKFEDSSKIEVYIFNDIERYRRFRYNRGAQSLGGSTTNEAFISIPTIRKRLASDLCQREACVETVESVLLHELSHVHLRQYLGSWRYVTDVPQWFHEGLATYVSGGTGAGRVSEEDAKKLIQSGSHLLPHDSGRFFQRKEAVGDLRFGSFAFYRQSMMFVSFLQRTNPAGFQNVIEAILSGSKFESVWEPNYGANVATLWANFTSNL